MTKRNIPIAVPSMGEEEWLALKGPIETGWLTQGPRVKAFETAFAEMHGVKHALAVSNCTTALHLALLACGVGPGDEVIVPAFTWVATANAVRYCGAEPVFVDIDLRTFNIDLEAISSRITSRTRAIMPVHLFGLCADVPAIRERFPQLRIVEDGACAAGASIHGRFAGSLGDIGCFSFHPRKSITCGEGGMLTTDDDELAARLDMLRNHGASISEEQRHHGPRPYLLAAYDIVGYNYRMTDLQGAVAAVQLGKLNRFIEERNHWAAYYREGLAGIPWLRTPEQPPGYRHGWQSYVTLVDESIAPMPRNAMMERLQEMGISTRPGTHAVHMLGAYAGPYGYRPDDFPRSFEADRASMAIPLHNKMVQEDFDYIIEALKSMG